MLHVPFVLCIYTVTSGIFPVGVGAMLPVCGVSILLGNAIAGGKVNPTREVLDSTTVQSAS